MTRAEAHAVLDAVRDGAAISPQRITQALYVTGDLADEHAPIHTHRCAGSWERANARQLAPAEWFEVIA